MDSTQSESIINIINNHDWGVCKSTKEKVQGEITKEQRKMIKEEIKVWMDDYLKTSIKKEAGQLLKDIEKLKEEKTRLGKAISSLKQEMRKTKKEIQAEVASMEETLEGYANQILRFNMLDL